MPFDATTYEPAQASNARPVRDTRRIQMLAGCTQLGARLADAKTALNWSIKAHRRIQAEATKRHRASTLTPSTTRLHVLKAVATIRQIEAEVEAKYGKFVPVRGAV